VAQIVNKFLANNAVDQFKIVNTALGSGLTGGSGTVISVDSTVIRTNGANPFISNQSMGNNELTNIGALLLNGATSGTLTVQAAAVTSSYSITLPSAQGSGALTNNGSGVLSWVPSSGGTVTSVALADGSAVPIYSISNSPVTTSGTLTFTLNSQSSNTVFAAPNGSSGQPTFRLLVAADIPSLSSIYLPLAGGTMSGSINMSNNSIINLADPVNPQDAANKRYVDSLSQGISWKDPARVISTSPLASNTYNNGASGVGATLTSTTNNAFPAVDGVTLALNDRIVVAGEATSANNGIYYLSQQGTGSVPWILTRTLDADTPAALVAAAVFIDEGTVNSDTAWVQTAIAPITIGTTSLLFTKFANTSPYIFTNGLQQVGQTISVLPADASLSTTGSGVKVDLDPAGSLVTNPGGIAVQVDPATLKINGSDKLEGLKQTEYDYTLTSTDITNQYIDLPSAVYGLSAGSNSIELSVITGPVQQKAVDYVVSLTGGVAGVTRITFTGGLAMGGASALVSGDSLAVYYSYLT
jgi:hypothetical protein